MDTTKLIVEYLIVGILILLAIIFLVASLVPEEVSLFFEFFKDDLSWVGATLLLVVLLPIAYGIGLVTEYLGMILFEPRMEIVKNKNFPIYIQRNKEWLKKSVILREYAQKDTPIPRDAGNKLYGEMRFFALMKSGPLYDEIMSHINQARILRSLTIAEFLFLLGLIIQIIKDGFTTLWIIFFVLIFAFLILTIRAVIHRFNRYCRAIERSHKVLILENHNDQ